MVKRTLILALWFYAGWTLGGFVGWALAAPVFVGPVLGLCAVLVVLAGPANGSRNRMATRARSSSAPLARKVP